MLYSVNMLYAFIILLFTVLARVQHGAGGDEWYKTKWLLFAPALVLAAVAGYLSVGLLGLTAFFPVLACILLFFNGANADNTLSYMYTVEGSSLWNIGWSFGWRIALCVALVAGTGHFTLILPMVIGLPVLLWTARDNRAHPNYDERRTRRNVEWSEGYLGASNAAALWLVLINFLAGV